MAIDAIAMPGAPPIAAGPPEAAQAAAGSPSGDGKTFSDVIASAMEQPAAPAEGAPSATGEVVPPQAPGVNLAALLTEGDATDGAQDLSPITLDLRPDRDAGAEDVTAALAALMFGGVLPRPTAAPAPTAGGVVSTPAAAVAAATTTAPLFAASEMPTAAAPVVAASAAAAPDDAPVQFDGPVSEYGWRPTLAAKPVTAQQATPAVEVAPVAAPVIEAQAPAPGIVAGATAEDAPATQAEQPVEITSAAPEAAEAAPEPREQRAERADDATMTVAPYASAVVEARAPQVEATSAALTVDATSGPQLASNIADTVQAATLNGDRELRIAINPPDLGQLTVHITEHAAGGVTVAIQASSSEAHDLLQQHLPALRSGLEQREVRVEQLHVEQQAPSAGLGWADGGQQRSNGGRDAWASREESPWSPIAAMGGVRSTAAVTSRGPAEAGRVDLRA